MTDEQLIESMLAEIEYGYISYENLHNNNDRGLEIIKDCVNGGWRTIADSPPPVRGIPLGLCGIPDESRPQSTDIKQEQEGTWETQR